jgi:acyl-coenzyme A synthetase/AMP-(fatty) acid ligase
MIKTSGANVSPAEVEVALRELPEVREAIVIGLPDAKLGQIVVAAIVPHDGKEIDCAAVRAHLREEISSYKIPRIIVPMAYEEIPRTDAAGKPKREALKDILAARRDANCSRLANDG